jgi:hypothetical protein
MSEKIQLFIFRTEMLKKQGKFQWTVNKDQLSMKGYVNDQLSVKNDQ